MTNSRQDTGWIEELKGFIKPPDGGTHPTCYDNIPAIVGCLRDHLKLPTELGFEGCVDKNELIIASLIQAGMDSKSIKRVGAIIPTFNDEVLSEIDRARHGGFMPKAPHLIVPDQFRRDGEDTGIDNQNYDFLGEGVSFKGITIRSKGVTFRFPFSAPSVVDMMYRNAEGNSTVRRVHLASVPAAGHTGIAIKQSDDEWVIVDSSLPGWMEDNVHQWCRDLGMGNVKGYVLSCPVGGEKPTLDLEWMRGSDRDHYADLRKSYPNVDDDTLLGFFLGNDKPWSVSHPSKWGRTTLVALDEQTGKHDQHVKRYEQDWDTLDPESDEWEKRVKKHQDNLHPLRVLQEELRSSGKLNLDQIVKEQFKAADERRKALENGAFVKPPEAMEQEYLYRKPKGMLWTDWHQLVNRANEVFGRLI